MTVRFVLVVDHLVVASGLLRGVQLTRLSLNPRRRGARPEVPNLAWL
jgi:hypothetical protein